MNNLKKAPEILGYIKEVSEQLNRRSFRERGLILLTLLVVVYVVWNSFIYQPFIGSKSVRSKKVSEITEQIVDLKGKISNISIAVEQDPIVGFPKQIENLKQTNKRLELRIQELTKQLIPTKQMANLLNDILIKDKDLKVIEIFNLAEEELFTENSVTTSSQENNVNNKANFQVYKHGLEIIFSGKYFAVKNFLESIQELPWQILWDSLSYEVDEYPYSKVKLVVYTLSLQEGWISS